MINIKITTKTIGIKCAVCSRKQELKKAIIEEWKKCKICGLLICPDCILLVNETMNGVCPSTMFGFSKHKLDLENISTDEVLVFVKKIRRDGLMGHLIEKVFYAPKLSQIIEYDRSKKNKEIEKEAITREELWRRYGLVIVKRHRGKFIMWEKIK